MAEPVDIRKLKRKELRDILLVAKVYYPMDAWLSLDYLEDLERRSVIAYSIRWGERLVGAAMVTADQHPNYRLEFMVIDRNVSRRGLGESLYLQVERDLESGSMLWQLVPDNKQFAASTKFLAKMGMDLRGTLRGWFGRTDAAVYAKRIR